MWPIEQCDDVFDRMSLITFFSSFCNLIGAAKILQRGWVRYRCDARLVTVMVDYCPTHGFSSVVTWSQTVLDGHVMILVAALSMAITSWPLPPNFTMMSLGKLSLSCPLDTTSKVSYFMTGLLSGQSRFIVSVPYPTNPSKDRLVGSRTETT